MRFDWYQCTMKDPAVSYEPGQFCLTLADRLGGRVATERGLYGYTEQAVIRAGDGDVRARVLYGGANRWPNAWASSDATDRFVDLVREEWPDDHLVTRMDCAEDYRCSFESLCEPFLRLADEYRLRVSQAGDWYRMEAGRTLYVGSRKSPVFLRCYEKGLEQIGKAPSVAAAARIPRDWCRVELVVRPEKGPARARAAHGSAEDGWGYAAWSRELASRLMGLDVERVAISSWRQSDDERALEFMVRQYRQALGRRAEVEGSWEALGRLLGRKVGQIEETRCNTSA